MTQGAPRNTRKPAAAKAKPNPLVQPNGDEELDLDDWLATRGLAGKRRMKIGGRRFEFHRSATPAELTSHNTARSNGDIVGAIAALLADPGELDEFKAAFERQRQPLTPDAVTDFTVSMLNFVVYGDIDPTGSAQEKAGESSAS
jgi:hypothetical protein